MCGSWLVHGWLMVVHGRHLPVAPTAIQATMQAYYIPRFGGSQVYNASILYAKGGGLKHIIFQGWRSQVSL